MILWEILVPTVRNNGKPFRTRYHRVWDSKVRNITNGLTIMKPVLGQWVSKDKTYVERMIPVRIACTKKQMDQIIDMTLIYYDQEAVMAHRVSEECIIRMRDEVRVKPKVKRKKS